MTTFRFKIVVVTRNEVWATTAHAALVAGFEPPADSQHCLYRIGDEGHLVSAFVTYDKVCERYEFHASIRGPDGRQIPERDFNARALEAYATHVLAPEPCPGISDAKVPRFPE